MFSKFIGFQEGMIRNYHLETTIKGNSCINDKFKHLFNGYLVSTFCYFSRVINILFWRKIYL